MLEQTNNRSDADTFNYQDAMSRLVGLTGHEFPVRDQRQGLAFVLEQTGVTIPPEEIAALGNLLTSLSRHPRFVGNPFMAPETGEDPATHSLHVALLAREIIERSGISDPAKSELTARAVTASLIHDVGEIVGELSTLHGRLEEGQVEDSAHFEREMVKNSLLLALALGQEGRGDEFEQEMNKLTANFQLTGSRETTLLAFEELFEDLSDGAIHSATVAKWMRLYDAVEDAPNAPQEDQFIGYLAKTIEHLQGSQHFLRFSKRDDRVREFSLDGISIEPCASSSLSASLSTEQARSATIMGSIRYNEELVGDIFATASTPMEMDVARSARDLVYNYVVEYLEVATPIIDRTFGEQNKSVALELRQLLRDGDAAGVSTLLRAEELYLVRCHRDFRKELAEPESTLLPVETRLRLQALYRNAIERDFVPSSRQVLAGLAELPPELTPLEPKTSTLARRSHLLGRGNSQP